MSKNMMMLIGVFLCFASTLLSNKGDMCSSMEYLYLASAWIIAASFKKEDG